MSPRRRPEPPADQNLPEQAPRHPAVSGRDARAATVLALLAAAHAEREHPPARDSSSWPGRGRWFSAAARRYSGLKSIDLSTAPMRS